MTFSRLISRRLMLMALAAVALAGGLAALLPAPADAQVSLGDTRTFIRPGTETGDIATNVRSWNTDGTKHTTTMGLIRSTQLRTVWSQISAAPSVTSDITWWRMRVQSEPGHLGALLDGAVLTSPTTGWAGRSVFFASQACSPLSSWQDRAVRSYRSSHAALNCAATAQHRRSDDDGAWPGASGSTYQDVTVEFTVPQTHIGPVYLRFDVGFGGPLRSYGTTDRAAFEVTYRDPRGTEDDAPDPRALLATLTEDGSGGLEPCTDAATIHSGAATTASALWVEANSVGLVISWPTTMRAWLIYNGAATGDGSVDFTVNAGDLVFTGSRGPASALCVTSNQGSPRGATAWVLDGVEAFPAGVPAEDELVPFSSLAPTALVLTATDATIVHEDLCPHVAGHPLDTTPRATKTRCEISRAALMRFQGATEMSDPVQRLDFAYIPSSSSASTTGTVTATFNTFTTQSQTLTLAHGAAQQDAFSVAGFLDWAEAGRNYATAEPTVLFAVGRKGSITPKRAIPSGIAWSKFEDLAEDKAVELSINRGTIAYGEDADGDAMVCEKPRDSGACTLSLSRMELRDGTAATADTALTGNLRAEYSIPIDTPGPTSLTIRAWKDGETDPVETVFLIPHPDVGRPVASVSLPTDADALISPRQRVAISAGFTAPVGTSAMGWGCAGFGPSFLELTGPQTLVEGCTLARGSAAPMPATQWLTDDSYLVISGPASFDDGGKRLPLGGDWSYLRCGLAKAQRVADAGDRDVSCWVTNAAGTRPQITVDSDADEDIQITANLMVPEGRTLRLFTGPGESLPLDRYATASAIDLPGTVFGTATLRVGAIQELAAISIGRVPVAGVAPTGPIRISSSSAELRLAITNENNAAARLDTISSITLTVSGGGTLGGDYCSDSASCSIPTARGALFDAVAANPATTARIDVTFNAPDKPGESSIRAAVVGKDGGTFIENLVLTVSGSATELASVGEMPRVHSSATDDDRDTIKIPVTARDANGNAARMPTNAAARVRGIDGTGLPAGRLTSEVKCTDERRLSCNVEIVVTAEASSPLASGAYTAIVTGGTINTEVGFAVGGPAETVTLTVPDDADLPGLGQGFTVTASVVDRAGVPVADGTWVQFEASGRGAGSASTIVGTPPETDVDHDGNAETPAVKQRRAKTKNGEASATVIVVGEGISVLTATAGGKGRSVPLDTRMAAVPVAPSLEYASADREPAAGTWAVYRGTAAISAAELIELGPADAASVSLWNGRTWISYAEADGASPPGSVNFVVRDGDTIWFGE